MRQPEPQPKFRVDAANQLISDVPRTGCDRTQTSCRSAPGKDVVDIEHVSVSFGQRQVLSDITWRLGPGERTGILELTVPANLHCWGW